jgi:hypothetical protein
MRSSSTTPITPTYLNSTRKFVGTNKSSSTPAVSSSVRQDKTYCQTNSPSVQAKQFWIHLLFLLGPLKGNENATILEEQHTAVYD